MKRSPFKLALIQIAMLFFAASCGGGGSSDPQSNSGEVPDNTASEGVLIDPVRTDPDYAPGQEAHYIVEGIEPARNRLVLFIGGSYSVPGSYYLFCDYAAEIGFDVISLSYPNGVAAAPLGSSPDRFVFDHYRDEVCFGNPVSDVVAVGPLDSIYTRTVKLLQYLASSDPDGNWEQYLTAEDTPEWSRIIVAGHSQGSGHACYLAKAFPVLRVLMFSGPNDYGTFFDAPAPWLSGDGLTSVSAQFALLHSHDEMVSFLYQVENLRDLGLLNADELPVEADKETRPFNGAHALRIDIPAISNHNAPIGGNPLLPGIWEYMLGVE